MTAQAPVPVSYSQLSRAVCFHYLPSHQGKHLEYRNKDGGYRSKGRCNRLKVKLKQLTQPGLNNDPVSDRQTSSCEPELLELAVASHAAPLL